MELHRSCREDVPGLGLLGHLPGDLFKESVVVSPEWEPPVTVPHQDYPAGPGPRLGRCASSPLMKSLPIRVLGGDQGP